MIEVIDSLSGDALNDFISQASISGRKIMFMDSVSL